MTPLDKQYVGLAGIVTKTGTGTVTGDFCKIHCITAVGFTALVNNKETGDSLVGVAIPAGTILFGKFSSFAVAASQTVQAYTSATLA